jgi:glycosyltransferase involved in cell wall biosynthesis
MRGAAPYFADLINTQKDNPSDLIIATDFLNLADLRGLLHPPWDRVPCLLYMHENQLTYPLSPEEEFDFHFGFTNIISALTAESLVFNSEYHRELFLNSLPNYLAKMPEAVPRHVDGRLASKSLALPVGLEHKPHPLGSYAPYLGGSCAPDVGPPWPRDGKAATILWNHRWEFDKRPDLFARSLLRLAAEGVHFQILLLGEPRGHEEVFSGLRDTLGRRCLAYGFQPDRAEYDRMLARSDIVVSCAEQEYFGIAVAEAVHAGAYALLPKSQVYPSLYGRRCKGKHFYSGEEELVNMLRDLLTDSRYGHVCSLPLDCDAFCWERLIDRYDELFCEVAGKE